jgi:hypothetical protein
VVKVGDVVDYAAAAATTAAAAAAANMPKAHHYA